jgi:hypothetical protein
MRLSSVSPAVVLAFLGLAETARADDPPLRLMHETTSYTDVIDAFDGQDPFDLNAHVHYNRSSDNGRIKREYTTADGKRKLASIADSERITSTLNFGLDIGLYKDFMVFVRLPLIVSDARSLSLPSGRTSDQVQNRLTDPNGAKNGNPASLFSVPFDSPTRAGFDYIGFGGAVSILNQQRHSWQPTWVLMLEGRRALGSPLKPCVDDADQGGVICGATDAPDIDGDGQADDGTNARIGEQSSGSSRGVSGITVETRLSRRYRYAEPYGGLGVLVEWPSTSQKYFNPAGNLNGVINTLPAQQVSATLGTAVIPWENRARWQRFALDLRLQATYYTEGHDYSALYDALGTSNHYELSRPNYEGVKGITDPNAGQLDQCNAGKGINSNCTLGAKVPFYGLTDIQSHLKYGFRVGLEMQAAQYVRFSFGSGFWWVTNHAITMSDACNPYVSDNGRRESFRGATCADANEKGIVNPNHRPTIDLPGRRFWMTSELIVDLYATATAQF